MSRYPNQAFEHYWMMWNSVDLDEAMRHLPLAVTEDFIFCDPVENHVGRAELERNVRTFRDRFPNARFDLCSGFDNHHNRYRYRWDMINRERVLIEGTDIATVADGGLIERIDGFFGAIPTAERA